MILIIYKRLGMTAAGAALLAAACAPAGSESPEPRVVATTGILGDVAAQLIPEDQLDVLIPVGVDPHEFEPSPRQAELLAEADLVMANGLGLEEAMGDLLGSLSGTRLFEAGCVADPLPWPGEEPRGCGESDEGHLDPHFWLDPRRMALVVDELALRLSPFAPDVSSKAAGYRSELEALDAEIEATLAGLESNQVVTNHDFFRYFADRYSLEILGVVIPGGSTLTEPSPSELAALVAVIDQYQIPVILTETTEPARLASVVASEADHPVELVELYEGSLGEAGSGADTYLGLMRTNLERIALALGR